MKNVPYLLLSFTIGLRDYTLRAWRFEFTDNGAFSLVPFASQANIATLLVLGFITENHTDWEALISPEELRVTISDTHYATGPHSEQHQLLLEAAVTAREAFENERAEEAREEQAEEARQKELGPVPAGYCAQPFA